MKIQTMVSQGSQMEKAIKYANDEIILVWKPDVCQHSTLCFSELPEVFNPMLRKWVTIDGASSEKINEQAKKCPSGTLTWYHPVEKILSE